MGRFRTISRKSETDSYNDYYQKKESTETLKFARSIINTKKSTDNFSICCYNCRPVKSEQCYIAVFQSYASLIKLLKRQAYLDRKCTSCKDVPLTLMNGLTSEICVKDFYKSVDHYIDDDCKKLTIQSVNKCTEILGNLYPYGYFNNNCKSPNISLKRKLFLTCDKKTPCPTYIFCKCPPNTPSCKCCDYNVVFPFQNTFLSYTISGCQKKELYEYFNNPTNNPSKTYEIHQGNIDKSQSLQKISRDAFSKYNYQI